MRINDDGDFVCSPEEVFVMRQGLFVAVYHLDPAFEGDLGTITGVPREEFGEMMSRVDDLRRSQNVGDPWA